VYYSGSTIVGFQCHAIQNTSKLKSKLLSRLSPESEKKKEGTCNYAKTLAKFQVTAIRLMEEQRDGRKPTETFVIEFCSRNSKTLRYM